MSSTPGGVAINCKACTKSTSTARNIDAYTVCHDEYVLKPENVLSVPICRAFFSSYKACIIYTQTPPATIAGKIHC